MARPRTDARRVALALVALGALAAPASHAAPAPAPRPIVAGESLAAALDELVARGLPLVYSSRVVRPEMTVAASPAATDARAQLDELLAPHGLVARAGAGGSLVIETASAPAATAAVAGRVSSRRAGEPLAGVVVRVVAAGLENVTGGDGSYRLDGVPPGVHEVDFLRPGFVVETVRGVVARGGETSEVSPQLVPAPFAGDEIVVQPSRATVLRDEPASVVRLDRDELLALPHLGNDVLRALEVLPGVASNDVSAQFHVRGGRRDEVLVLLDGQELYEAFHLKDFDSALSLVAATNLTGVHLSTGAFAVDHGDRMGGVLELSTAPPPVPGRVRLAANLLGVEASLASATGGGDGGWLLHGRHGTARLGREVLDREQPDYWDLFGRVDHRFDDRQSARLNLLAAGDRYDLDEPGVEESKRIVTRYDVAYLWLTHQAVASARLFVDTALSWSGGDRDRRADEHDDEKSIRVVDLRASRVAALQQSWNAQIGDRHHLKAGVVARRYRTDYDYLAARAFDTPLAALRTAPGDGATRLDARYEDDHLGLFAVDRWRVSEALTVELGVRRDDHSLLDQAVTSPRVQLAWAVRPGHLLRVGWGRYAQSQRPYELAVEDGESAFAPLERSTHNVIGYERLFGTLATAGLTAVRLELYRRTVKNPRPRYENLFEPFDAFPEGETDRYRFAATQARAEGAELYLRARLGRRVDGWLDYAWARSEDRIDGRWVPRLIDQRHTINFVLHGELTTGWSLDLAGLFHSGRPTTTVTLVETIDDEGERARVPQLGPLGGERLDDYFRLDLRLARRYAVRRGHLTLHVDAQNLLDRENDAGFSVELDEESGALAFDPERWPGFVASAGVAWEL
ncbi:MAG: TonB-dependent receptor [Thermoanaerobaculia bacterium]|nr:TonB-dependent receptor [Thermoanaerobaculia bacterium]